MLEKILMLWLEDIYGKYKLILDTEQDMVLAIICAFMKVQ